MSQRTKIELLVSDKQPKNKGWAVFFLFYTWNIFFYCKWHISSKITYHHNLYCCVQGCAFSFLVLLYFFLSFSLSYFSYWLLAKLLHVLDSLFFYFLGFVCPVIHLPGIETYWLYATASVLLYAHSHSSKVPWHVLQVTLMFLYLWRGTSSYRKGKTCFSSDHSTSFLSFKSFLTQIHLGSSNV